MNASTDKQTGSAPPTVAPLAQPLSSCADVLMALPISPLLVFEGPSFSPTTHHNKYTPRAAMAEAASKEGAEDEIMMSGGVYEVRSWNHISQSVSAQPTSFSV